MWIQNKPWYVNSKELRGGLCKVYVLFDRNSGSKPRGKFIRTIFKDVGKSGKIAKHKTTECHKDALEKAKDFLELYEDPTKLVTYDKNSDEKYECNIHAIKIIILAVLLCAGQGIALKDHREQDS